MLSAQTGLYLDPEAQLLVLPPGEDARGYGFATWHDTGPAFRRFILAHTGDPSRIVRASEGDSRSARIPVLLGLLPRPDNTYDPRAISVTAPPSHGGSVLDRHLGYLFEKWLHRMNPLIRDLATFSPVPVGCHGHIELYEIDTDHGGGDGEGPLWVPKHGRPPLSRAEEAALGYQIGSIRLQWAWSDVLQAAISEYIDSRIESEYAGGPPADVGRGRSDRDLRQAYLTRQDEPLASAQAARTESGDWGKERVSNTVPDAERGRARAAREAAAAELCAAWATWRHAPHGHRLTTVSRALNGPPAILLVDGDGRKLGQWHLPHGPLTLDDERTRADALRALQAGGCIGTTDLDLDKLAEFPNATVTISGARWSVRAVVEGVAREQQPEIASYDHGLDLVTVYARQHRELVQNLLRRHGVDADSAWVVDPPEEPENPRLPDGGDVEPFRLRLRDRVRHLLPAEYADVLGIQWGTEGARTMRSTQKELRANPYYLRELGTLLGVSAGDLRPSQCRLCHDNALAAPDGLAYCFGCVRWAQGRWLRDDGTDGPWIDAVVWALRRVVELEFSGPPSVAQLNRLHVRTSATADAAMLCRFLIPRPALATLRARTYGTARTWAEWLHRAGLLSDGLRTGRGTVTVATDGHPCRSMLERHIDDFLHHSGIDHDIEPAYPWHPELNTTGLRADWLLDDGTYVEALGMPDDPAYAAKVARKRQLADALSIPLVTLTAEDLNRLPDVFAAWQPVPPSSAHMELG